MKTCFKCGVDKESSEFYRHPAMADGLLGKCKECTRKDSRDNRAARIEYYRSYDRERGGLSHRRMARAVYQQTDSGRAAHSRASLRWINDHPRARSAHIRFNNAKRSNPELAMQPCEECGALPSHAHHENYDYALRVIWLCPAHHKDRHAEMYVEGVTP